MTGEVPRRAQAESLFQVRDFDRLLHESLLGLNSAVGNMLDIPATFPDNFHIELNHENTFNDTFPAHLQGTRPETFQFNIRQFQLLVKQTGFSENVNFEDVARLYIGGSLPLKILESHVSPQQSNKVNRLLDIFTNSDELADAIRRADFTDPVEQNQLFHIMGSDETAIVGINGMRFAIGTFFEAEKLRGNEQFVDNIQQSFQQNLHLLFRGKNEFLRLFQSLKGSSKLANQEFERRVRSLGLAVCFPMQGLELRMVFDALHDTPEEQTYEFGVVISEDDVQDGFRIE